MGKSGEVEGAGGRVGEGGGGRGGAEIEIQGEEAGGEEEEVLGRGGGGVVKVNVWWLVCSGILKHRKCKAKKHHLPRSLSRHKISNCYFGGLS